ncbi:acylphosphatase [Mesorhizobium opportunistum WSM2075]|uniref:acylphosphatase n=2 Tax=Phyllobacteriaceae TaxID=69277 RepID=F7Y7E6_MESOW|nr:acylphosphatase [Mesorhizobium opportunistum WSM2075]
MCLGLTGWVRNERDGSVTALIAGADAAVDPMIERLWQGPRGALVSAVEVEEATDDAPADSGLSLSAIPRPQGSGARNNVSRALELIERSFY